MGLVAEDVGPVLAREQFLRGGTVEGAAVRSQILDSWQRSRSLGLTPDGCELPFTQDLDLEGRLVRAAGPVLDRLQARFAGRNMNVALADGRGAVLQRRFGDTSQVRHLAAIQSVPGFIFAEKYGGTNGIGLALTERRHINVYGAEHFAERSQSNACSATPIRDLLSGRIEGVLCFGYPYTDVDGALDVVIRKAASAIEARLLEQSSTRERALLQAYLDARRRVPAGDGQLSELAASGLGWRDQMILKEKATELISSGRRAAVEVSLPGDRRVTLLSRPVTSSSGVEGVVIEAILPAGQQRLAFSTPAEAPPGLLADAARLRGHPPDTAAPGPAATTLQPPCRNVTQSPPGCDQRPGGDSFPQVRLVEG
ncbi:protein phosphatase, partial [Streptomyces cinnamoneus]